ncbi:MAG: polysaccharide deacetylase family protein [Granulosicoccus sp.]|nr:polysaccharide deacetylase family protein [Granulosicoccus sp.]
MYHYVRDFARTRYPRIKGLDVADFRSQLAHLQRHYQLVSLETVIQALRGLDTLPPKATLLTFDDGYKEHYDTVFPILQQAGISGAFFPPVSSSARGILLDVNRVHFLLACTEATVLAKTIDQVVDDRQSELLLDSVREYRDRWAIANRFDDAETIYVKRMLQRALPESLRHDIASDLFSRHIGIEEEVFASELYCSSDQLRTMQACGMYIGSHGTSHRWLNTLSRKEQEAEVVESMDFLRAIGSPVDDYWAMAYPYGGWNEELIDVLTRHGCDVGFTTEVAAADLDGSSPLRLPRFDTNDVCSLVA